MDDFAAAPTPAPNAIDAVEAEMDAADRALLELVARRLKLGDQLAKLSVSAKPQPAFRPAREINMLRRLVAAAPEPVDADLVVELWRALLAANTRRHGPIDVAVAGGTDPVRLFDIARRHFGARTRIRRVGDPQAALLRALEHPNTVAVIPWLAAPGVGSWWPALSESRFHKLQLIAGLPMRGPMGEDPEACLFAAAPAEETGGDVTLMIVFDPHHRAQRALAEVGFKGREVGRSEPRALLRVEGFVAADDVRAASMTRYGIDSVRVLGSYARV